MRKQDLEAAWEKKMVRIGMFVGMLDAGKGCMNIKGGEINEIRIKMPSEDRGDTLVIVKVSGPEGQFVGFVGAPDLESALLTWMKREGARGVQFREDRPWVPPET